MGRVAGLLERLERSARWLEDGLLVVTLLSMIVLASLQILLRNVFDSGIIWADGVVRFLVLWVAFLGAVVASRDNKQIRIDVLSRFLPRTLRYIAWVTVDVFTVVVCGLLTWTSWQYVGIFGSDRLLGGMISAGAVQIIMPVGFAIITYRYVLHALRHANELMRGERQ